MQSRRRYSGDIVHVHGRTDTVDVPEDNVRELKQSIDATRLTAPPGPLIADLAPVQTHPIDAWVSSGKKRISDRIHASSKSQGRPSVSSLVPWFVGAGLVIAGLLYVSSYGISVKNRVVKQGSAAIGYLVSARDSLEQLDVEHEKTDKKQEEEYAHFHNVSLLVQNSTAPRGAANIRDTSRSQGHAPQAGSVPLAAPD